MNRGPWDENRVPWNVNRETEMLLWEGGMRIGDMECDYGTVEFQ